jgi:hypothetical protein
LSFGFKDVRWAASGFIIATWIGSIILFIAAKAKFKLSFPTMALLEPVIASAPSLAVVLIFMPKIQHMWVKVADQAQCASSKCSTFVVAGQSASYFLDGKKFLIVGADLLIILIPFALIMFLFGKRRKKLEPALEDAKK